MRLFNTLSVEISALCNRGCTFCPVSVFKRDDDLMEDRVLVAIAEELGRLSYRGRIELYIYNEPLKHREQLEKACKLLRRRVPGATLMISTNGDYLKGVDDILWLYSLGIQQIVMNAYSPKQYPKYREWEADVKRRIPSVTENVYTKIPKKAVALKVYNKTDASNFGSGIFALQNRAGSIPHFLPPTMEPMKKMCVKPFRLLNINWRGEAMICCNDFYADVPAGKVPDQSLVEIWEGPVFSAYRKKLLGKDRSLPLCRVCDCHSGAYPGNVTVDKGAALASKESIEELFNKRVSQRTQ